MHRIWRKRETDSGSGLWLTLRTGVGEKKEPRDKPAAKKTKRKREEREEKQRKRKARQDGHLKGGRYVGPVMDLRMAASGASSLNCAAPFSTRIPNCFHSESTSTCIGRSRIFS